MIEIGNGYSLYGKPIAMRNILLIIAMLLVAVTFAQSDYYIKKAQSYQREAEYYQKKAEGYRKDATYYLKKLKDTSEKLPITQNEEISIVQRLKLVMQKMQRISIRHS